MAGKSILSKIKEAVPERSEHQEDLREFEESLSAGKYKEQLSKWKEGVEAWEDNMLNEPNPFEVKSNGVFRIRQSHSIT